MPDSSRQDLDLQELSDRAGITPRAIRYYIEQGLLPAAGPGRGSRKYGAAYLNRLRLIRHLQHQHLSLAAIRQKLEGMTDEDVARALGAMSGNEAAQPLTEARSSAKEYLAALLTPVSIPATSVSVRRHAEMDAPSLGGLKPQPLAIVAAASLPAKPGSSTAPVSEAWPKGRAQWERLILADDIELHVRRPLSREMNRRIDRLLEVARRILHEN